MHPARQGKRKATVGILPLFFEEMNDRVSAAAFFHDEKRPHF